MDAHPQFSDNNPSFFRQGCLILAPIAVLTLFGFISLRQDWLMVEQGARQRAGEIAADLQARLGHAIAWELAEYELFGNRWEGDGAVRGPIFWPGSSPINAESKTLNDRINSDWRNKHPSLSSEQVFPVRAQLSADGAMLSPVDYPDPPLPPAWIQAIEAESKLANDLSGDFAVQEANSSGKAVEELAQLDSSLRISDTSTRIQLWVNFANRHETHLSESGIPISTIALARALRNRKDS